MANRKLERKSWSQIFAEFLQAHLAPHWCCFGFRIPGRQQQLRLMRAQRFRGFPAGGPPPETSLR
jgi:hypothetical protein